MKKISLYERLKLCAVFQAAAHIFLVILGGVFFIDFTHASLISLVFRFSFLIVSFLFAPFFCEKLKLQKTNNNTNSFFQKFKATMLFSLPLFFFVFSRESFSGDYSDLFFLFSFGMLFYIFCSSKIINILNNRGINLFDK